MKLVFATNNSHKLEEVRQILGDRFEVLSLNDIGCHEDIPETGDTFQDNALQKARYVKEHYGYDCFADDTGLEVKALDGAPGVHSARYAGDHDSEANMTSYASNVTANCVPSSSALALLASVKLLYTYLSVYCAPESTRNR